MDSDWNSTPKLKTASFIAIISFILLFFGLNFIENDQDKETIKHVLIGAEPNQQELRTSYTRSTSIGADSNNGLNNHTVQEKGSTVMQVKELNQTLPKEQPLSHHTSSEKLMDDSDHLKGTVKNQTSYEVNTINSIESENLTKKLFRIQFEHKGRCVGIAENDSLIVSFCDPTTNQAFFFSDGKLKSEETSLCVGLKNSLSNKLHLLDCAEAIRLTLEGGKLILRTGNTAESEIRCLSPCKSKDEPATGPYLGAAVALTKCHPTASKVKLLDESAFLRDRAALMMPLVNETSCNLTACRANHRPPMAKLLPEAEVNRCKNLSECLTVVVKTARRPLLVIRLAESIRKRLHQDLPMIVIDDGPMPHPSQIMAQIANFSNIKYIVSEKADLGKSEGRMIGVKMVKTKYFVNMDDDNVVTKKWDAAQMTDLLDTTDLTLVGGTTDNKDWNSFLDFRADENGDPQLFHYHGSCTAANQGLPFYPDCLRCDLTSKSFIAKTKDILEVGGWSLELKVHEHQDLFLRLKAAGKKVVWCPKFLVKNLLPETTAEYTEDDKKAYKKLRHKGLNRMTKLFCNHWNINEYSHHGAGEKGEKTWLLDV